MGIEFDHVTFVYPDGESRFCIIEGFKGQMIASFIGSTRPGSTLVNLIPRFYDVGEVYIKINGKDGPDYDVLSYG